MIRQLLNLKAVHKALALLAAFVVAAIIFPPAVLVEMLNGLFIGVLFTVTVVYRKLIADSFTNYMLYTRVQQFAIGCALTWVAIACARFASIYFRSNGGTSQIAALDYVTAFGIYTAVCAGYMQITAPGWDDGYMHGRDRFTLVMASAVGIAIAFFVFWVQERY
jgi:hypothetical protein